VALSVIHPDNDPAMGPQLAALRRALPAGIPLLVGGAAAAAYRAEVVAAHGQVVVQLAELRGALRMLASRG
jgi:hypothetical protein